MSFSSVGFGCPVFHKEFAHGSPSGNDREPGRPTASPSESLDKPKLVALSKRLAPMLLHSRQIISFWIAEPDRIRYREE